MKKTIFIFLLCGLCFLTSCGCTTSSESVQSVQSVQNSQNQSVQQAEVQKDLRQLFEERTNESVYDIFYMNLPEDEYDSAFIFAGSDVPEDSTVSFQGSLWYIDKQDCILLKDNIETFLYEPTVLEYEGANHLLFITNNGLADSNISYIWTAKNHKPELILQAPYYCFLDKGQLAIVKTFSSYSSGGRIWQRYYIYWNPDKQKYQEYAGHAITTQEFLSYENSMEMQERLETVILDKIDTTYKIDKVETEYIMRDNGIININYSIYAGEQIYYYYAWLRTAGKEIDPVDPTCEYICEKGYIFESGEFDL